MQVFGEWAQVEVVELVNDGSGLAFGIVGGRSSGVLVKSVLPGGVADRDGRLKSGDMLLRIGAVCVVGMCARQAAAVLRQCGVCVRLLVARPAPQPGQSLGASSAPVVPSRLLAEPAELERKLAEAGHDGFGVLCEDRPASPTIIEESHLYRSVASIVAVVPRGALSTAPPPPPPAVVAKPEPTDTPEKLPLDMAVRGPRQPETLSYEVELNKNTLGLGITVAGYVCEQEELSGIFVKSISEGSSADLSGKMQVNDRIVEVDGVSLNGVSNHRAVQLLRDAKGPIVKLKALRYLRGAGFERLQRALAAQDGRPLVAPPSPSVTSLAKFNFSVYEESTVIDAELDSEAHHLPSPTSPSSEKEIVMIGVDDDEIQKAEIRRIQDKWRDLLDNDPDWPGYPNGYDIIVGTIIKDSDVGVGISLEGTVQVVGGREVSARHYIRAVAPKGAVARRGVHRVGDELVEVNGWKVLGAHHVEVVSRLRAVASPVTLVCVRERQKESERTITRNAHGGSLQDLLSPPQRLIKAKSESSVASICSASTVMSGHGHDEFCPEVLHRNRSRSLEPLSGLAMWSDEVVEIELIKEDRGLGFSILDYLDPMDPSSSVIVVRSVVPGGAAAAAGGPAPGDRLRTVNGVDVASGALHYAVTALKTADKGIVRIGVSKPLPSSTVVGGSNQKAENSLSSQECINSLASDDHTGMDSFHECLQEYGEGLEVVQICFDPDDTSIKDEEVSALGDMSIEEVKLEKVNGTGESKSKSFDSLEDNDDDDLTMTEDVLTPRELPDLRKDVGKDRSLSKQQSKDISTSDEMVFAVTPTGLERISYDKYWKECDSSKVVNVSDQLTNYDSSNNHVGSETSAFRDVASNMSVQEKNNLLFIDHEAEGYETCLEECSNSIKTSDKVPHKTEDIKNQCKQSKTEVRKDSVTSAKSNKTDQNSLTSENEDTSHGRPYIQEHIIKQMKSLRIEPLNVNIGIRKKRKSPTKPSTDKQTCIEYYNDQAECLEEYKRQKQIEEEEKQKRDRYNTNLAIMEKKIKLKKQEPSEESTDLDSSYAQACHKCFLESYAYEIRKAYIEEANACKYCAVVREMLESSKMMRDRRLSAPPSLSFDSTTTDTEDEDFLTIPGSRDRRKSAGPLKFLVPSRKLSASLSPAMTVTVSGARRTEPLPAQRWGSPRHVTLARQTGQPLGLSIVGGKIDISEKANSDDSEEKSIFGIFIKNVVDDTPAGNCGELSTGDRILEVDGVCVRSATHERAVELIKAAGDMVTLTVQSLLAWNTDSSDVDGSPKAVSPTPSKKAQAPPPPPPVVDGTPEHEIKITVTSEADPEPEKPVYSDSESSEDEDERHLSGRTYSDKGHEIDRASAAAIKRSREEKEADPEEEDDFGYTASYSYTK